MFCQSGQPSSRIRKASVSPNMDRRMRGKERKGRYSVQAACQRKPSGFVWLAWRAWRARLSCILLYLCGSYVHHETITCTNNEGNKTCLESTSYPSKMDIYGHSAKSKGRNLSGLCNSKGVSIWTTEILTNPKVGCLFTFSQEILVPPSKGLGSKILRI